MMLLVISLIIPLWLARGYSLEQFTSVIGITTTLNNGSLQYYLCEDGVSNLTSDTTLLLSGGVHHLQEGHFCLLQNLNHFRIQGQKTGPGTVIHCRSDSEVRRGIAFFNITNLILSHLQIINCGREIPSGLPGHVNKTFAYLGPRQKAVVIISHCIDVTVESVSIDRCVGFGILFINPLGQTTNREVTIRDTTSQILSECKNPLNRTDMLCSGSGMVAVFNDTLLADKIFETQYENNKTEFIVNNCTFSNNTNYVSSVVYGRFYSLAITGGKTESMPLTGGIALAILSGQKRFQTNVMVLHTKILSNRGGDLNFCILYYNTINSLSTQVDQLTVHNNQAQNIGSGLVILGLIFLDSINSLRKHNEVDSIYNIATITNSHFSNNTADRSAGILFYMTTQNIFNVNITLKQTNFTDNVAVIGPAVHIYNYHTLTSSGAILVYMEDIVAMRNRNQGKTESGESSPENTGIFFFGGISNVTVVGTSERGCFFSKNKQSVFMTTRTNLILRGEILFEDNVGYRGGGLSLIESSILFIYNNSNIVFKRNRAHNKGGAIYINIETPLLQDSCTIQYFSQHKVKLITSDIKKLNISLVFKGNRAVESGNSVYAHPLYRCLFLPTSSVEFVNTTISNNNLSILYEEIFRFEDSVANGLSDISSIEEYVCVCSNSTFSREECTAAYYENIIQQYPHLVVPGSTVNIALNTVDTGQFPVASVLYSYIYSSPNSGQVEFSENQEVRSLLGIKNCSLEKFIIFAKENVTIYIDLFVSAANLKTTIELQTAFCPPGFTLEPSDGRCLCSDFVTSKLESNCDTTSYTIARQTHSWIGTTDCNDGSGRKTVQFAATCPIDRCREDVTDIDLRVSDHVCVNNRTGTLCGRCREGFSSVFGSAECRKCSHQWIGTLFLLLIYGLILVIPSLMLDLTITHGLVNGFIFYSSMVIVSVKFFFPGYKKRFLYGMLSLSSVDTPTSLCFYDGMTETAKVGFQYVYSAYLMIVIGSFILLIQRSSIVQRLFSSLNGIHVLVTVVYINFTKVFRTVVDTFTFVKVISENQEEKHVWFFDGNKEASDPDLLFLIILGCLTLVGFILPYIIFFTFPNYIQRWINSTRLNAYVDASLAPYKDNMRFWFGARLVLMSIIYIIITSFGTENPELALTLELSLLFGFAIVQAYICPFKKVAVAIIDMFCLLNLITITLAPLYTHPGEESNKGHGTVLEISLSISLLAYQGVVIWHILRRLRQRENIRIKTDRILNHVKTLSNAVKQGDWKAVAEMVKENVVKKKNTKPDNCVYRTETTTVDDDDFEVAVKKVGLKTTCSVVSIHDRVNSSQSSEDTSLQLREPVLDFVEN